MLSGEGQPPKVALWMLHLHNSYKGSGQVSRLGRQSRRWRREWLAKTTPKEDHVVELLCLEVIDRIYK